MVQARFVFFRKSLGQMFYSIDNDFSAVIDTQNAGIQAKVIILCLAPGPTGIVMVVYTAALVFFLKSGLGALLGFTVQANNAFCSVGCISKNIDMQSVFPILQNIVRVPSDNNAGALLSQLKDNIALNIPEEIRGRKAIHNTGDTLGGKSIGEEAASRGMLTMLLNKLRGKTGFNSNLIHELLVVEGDSQFLCDHFTDGTAAAAKFTADRDNLLFHNNASLSSVVVTGFCIIIVKLLLLVNKMMCKIVDY